MDENRWDRFTDTELERIRDGLLGEADIDDQEFSELCEVVHELLDELEPYMKERGLLG